MATWYRSITWVLVMGTLLFSVGCGVRKPREDAENYRERLRNTAHVKTVRDVRRDIDIFTFEDPAFSGLSLVMNVDDESCFYDVRILEKRLVCIVDGGPSICWWHDDATGQRISGAGYLEFHGQDRLRVETKIIIVDGHKGPIIEIRCDTYDRGDWDLWATLARDEAGRYWLFHPEDTRWLKWNGLVVDSHVVFSDR